MKFRRTLRFHSLKRVRVRQTWNKYNLYNLFNVPFPLLIRKTFFQQKWLAKALLRGYHGEHIKEKQWEKMFSRRLDSVVDMDPRYMAAFDGSEQATGRGSGRQVAPQTQVVRQPWAGTNVKDNRSTPYMQMTFAPMERRLDIAVFRAMFASSARQARQFVVHGAVTVNGRKMIYPGYLLNPGDLFQVDVDRVLYATGAKKRPGKVKYIKPSRAAAEDDVEAEAEEAPAEASAEASTEEGKDASAEPAEPAKTPEQIASERAARELPRLAARAKKLLSDSKDELGVKRKQKLRAFVKDARKWVAKSAKAPVTEAAAPPSSEIVDRLAELLAELPALSLESNAAAKKKEAEAAGADDKKDGDADETDHEGQLILTEQERRHFHELLARDAENPIDLSKPYATPWRPRPYMQHFACIPRYLEVNQNICAAVYLRHPVARPGESEVPTPYPEELTQMVHNWYLRRH